MRLCRGCRRAAPLLLTCLLVGMVQHALAGRSDTRRSYLRDFMAMRREIFPLSSDLRRRSSQSDPSPSVMTSPVPGGVETPRGTVRRLRHSAPSTVNTNRTPKTRETILQSNYNQLAASMLPEYVVKNQREGERNRNRARKIKVHGSNALYLQYNNLNHVNEFKPVKLSAVQNSELLDYRNISNEYNFQYPVTTSSIPSSTAAASKTVTNNPNLQIITREQLIAYLRGSYGIPSKNDDKIKTVSTAVTEKASSNNREKIVTQRPLQENSVPSSYSLFDTVLASLRRIPILGNVLRATVDPVYRPILNSILPIAENRQFTEEFNEEVNCFGSLGCLATTIDFYDPIIRPINLPADTRESINTHYTLYTRTQQDGVHVSPNRINKISDTTYNPANPTKFIIHGFLDDQNSTWIKDMTRGLLKHGDYNVLAVDWSGGSRVMYHQAVSNIRVVALEVSALINWMHQNFGQKIEDVHVIGHSLGSHMAGHIGERVKGLGRITGLDPAEPFFQYMPASVRLDPTDAQFVDVIHTDTDSIITVAWQFAGYGLEQPAGHVDFYPNGGRQQPGCSSLSRIPLIALQDGAGIAEGWDAAEKEAVACNHIRASKLFTASLLGTCSFQAFPCKSYKEFDKAKCFSCNTELGCAPLGIHADTWKPRGNTNVKMYLSTSLGPDFCQYHYRLTLTLGDERSQGGSLRGRLKVTLITQEGELKEFDLTQNSPLVFRRGSTRTFLLRHGEDLSLTQDALLHWQFEADVFNLMTFCVLFCTAELEVAAVTLTPLDTPKVTDIINLTDGSESADIVMCHKQGNPVIKIKSESTIKISAEPFCPAVRRLAEAGGKLPPPGDAGTTDLHDDQEAISVKS